jgi:hypothetical protein
MTNIKITIDELVLDGATGLDQAQLIEALQQALAAQLTAQSPPQSGSIPVVRQEMGEITAVNVAQQLAQSIYGGGQ